MKVSGPVTPQQGLHILQVSSRGVGQHSRKYMRSKSIEIFFPFFYIELIGKLFIFFITNANGKNWGVTENKGIRGDTKNMLDEMMSLKL